MESNLFKNFALILNNKVNPVPPPLQDHKIRPDSRAAYFLFLQPKICKFERATGKRFETPCRLSYLVLIIYPIRN